ncbi:phosphoribosylglycinamide formyltransferase [Virgibacillus alimentarius]|uniref:Phosphoribosylglycinamide formyltransferase n=1 Tax=Virgibacillus alimentarius TaxID=698769 RepID=A0ABS4S873_9BACI|nr:MULTISPECIES: phosphoribosylglycinamide formyltransferase [Virgibacillus]MBP2257691.1 phosphoribosylglycinamide formyltransferase-1 [Virgibacillus alimentarius]HLR69315.1 phosphoribosylglycinamide formyltransferase [Virgibacillus sp.]
MRKKAAVFASGTGSNFEAIINKADLACDIVLLVCDKPGAVVVDKANLRGISTFVCQPKEFHSKEAYEKQIVEKLQEAKVEWIFLAGYMRIVGPTLLNVFEGRMINIHPSLLPKFPGKDAIERAYQAGVDKTGVTVHFVDKGVDTGPIIAQREVPVLQGDTKETLKQRIQQTEHQLYPEVVKQLILKK